MSRSHPPDELADLFDRPGLSLERLHSLVRVADAGGIAAATDSPSEQSQISRQLGDLEEYLGGAELTRRRGRTLELTEDGRELAARAREFLRHVAGLRQKTAPDAPVALALGAGDSVLVALVIPAVAVVARRTPRLEVSVTSLPAERPFAAVEVGRLHAVVARDAPRGRAMEALAVGSWDVRLYVAKAALRRGATALDVLRRVPLALQTSEPGFERRVVHAAAAKGVALRPALSCETFAQAREAARCGYAAVLPVALGAPLAAEGIVEVPTPGDELGRHEATLWLAHDKRLAGQLPRTHAALVAIAEEMRRLATAADRPARGRARGPAR